MLRRCGYFREASPTTLGMPSRFPLYMTHGQGPLKWDVDGNEYVDYVSGHGALLLGHSHPAIAEAVSQQVQRGTHLGRKHRRRDTMGQGDYRLDTLCGKSTVSQLGDRGHVDGHAACPGLYG